MQSNTPAVENQPINFSHFPIGKKAHKADPFTIKDARYIGSDGFAVPSDFEEFDERFCDAGVLEVLVQGAEWIGCPRALIRANS
jgi:hypothetical protein